MMNHLIKNKQPNVNGESKCIDRRIIYFIAIYQYCCSTRSFRVTFLSTSTTLQLKSISLNCVHQYLIHKYSAKTSRFIQVSSSLRSLKHQLFAIANFSLLRHTSQSKSSSTHIPIVIAAIQTIARSSHNQPYHAHHNILCILHRGFCHQCPRRLQVSHGLRRWCGIPDPQQNDR